MDSRTFVAFRRSLAAAASRRGVLAGLTSAVLATGLVGLPNDDAEARRKGKRRNQRNKNKNKNNRNKNDKAKTRLDATCSGAADTGATHPAGEARLAQTFTSLRSGPLVKVTIPVTSELDTATQIVLHLSPVDGSGLPTDEVLAKATTLVAAPPLEIDELEFNFSFPFSVEAGVDYALVLSRPNGAEFVWRGDLGNACGGDVFISLDPAEPFERIDEDIDLIFEAFVKS